MDFTFLKGLFKMNVKSTVCKFMELLKFSAPYLYCHRNTQKQILCWCIPRLEPNHLNTLDVLGKKFCVSTLWLGDFTTAIYMEISTLCNYSTTADVFMCQISVCPDSWFCLLVHAVLDNRGEWHCDWRSIYFSDFQLKVTKVTTAGQFMLYLNL